MADQKPSGYRTSGANNADFPSVNGMGTRPINGEREGNTGRDKALGAMHPTSIIARGRFGGSRSMSVGATRNPITSRDRTR
jgi:hypothetical protein